MRPAIASVVRALLRGSLLPMAACGCPGEPELQPSDYTVSGDASGSGGGGDGSAVDCEAQCRGAAAYRKLQDAGFFESEISINGCSAVDSDTVQCSITTDCSAGRRPSEWVSTGAPCSSARAYWLATAELERASVVAFEELAATLREHGAPRGLVERALVAAEDERRHTRHAVRLAGDEPGERPPARPLGRALSLFELACLNAREGCVLEAFAAIQVAWQARHVGAAWRADLLTGIALDEAAHAELGWDVDAWLATRLSVEERRLIDREKQRAVGALPKLDGEAAWFADIGLRALPGLRGLRDDFASAVRGLS